MFGANLKTMCAFPFNYILFFNVLYEESFFNVVFHSTYTSLVTACLEEISFLQKSTLQNIFQSSSAAVEVIF